MLVLYGSQTGTARELAEGLGARLGARVEGCDEYERGALPSEQRVVFVVSTTGDGECPWNMRAFWAFLRRKALPEGVLSGLQVAVFGLGDSSYDKFNAVAKRLRNRLVQLGAREMVPIGLGDDLSKFGVEGDFDLWKMELCKVLGIASSDSAASKLIMLRSQVRVMPKEQPADESIRPRCPFPASQLRGKSRAPYLAQLTENQRITSEDWRQDVRHLEFTLVSDDGDCVYEAGDVVYVFPENSPEIVQQFCARLCLDSSQVVEIKPRNVSTTDPPLITSLKHLFSTLLDIEGTPRRSFFEYGSFFCSDQEEKERMMEISTMEGNDLFSNYCKRERRSYLEVLNDFKSCMIPLEYIIEMIPPMQARGFSIASSPLVHGKQAIHLCVAVVRFLTPWKRVKNGLCSSYLASLDPGSCLNLWVAKGTLRLPSPINAPLILIGPGTGIAPMRSLLFEKIASLPRADVKEDRLYFGCRHESKDYLYSKEWIQLVKDSQLGALRTAFSRDNPERKIYVMERLAQDRAILRDLILNKNAHIRVSGSAKRMPRDVKETFIQMFTTQDNVGMTREEAEKFVTNLATSGRYIVEAWS